MRFNEKKTCLVFISILNKYLGCESPHSRPQSCDPFDQRHGSRALAGSENRKSANLGLPAFCAASDICNKNGYHRLQKWAAIALARYPGPRQSSRSVALAKRIAALGTRMESPLFCAHAPRLGRGGERGHRKKERLQPAHKSVRVSY